MQKTIAVASYLKRVPGRRRRKVMPAYSRTINIKEPGDTKEPEPVQPIKQDQLPYVPKTDMQFFTDFLFNKKEKGKG